MHWHASDDLTLQQYLDGSLTASEHQAFSAHLQNCSSCQTELEAARRLEQLCQEWSEVQPPTQIAVRVRQQLQPRSIPYGWLLAMAAAVLLGFGISRGFWRRSPTPPELALHTPTPPARQAAPQLGEQPPTRPLAAQQVWSTGDEPNLVAFSGQILSLSPHTHLEVVSHQQDHYLLRLNRGQVRVQEHARVISVETEHLRVDPLGTDYQVTRGERRSQVYLFAGEVSVTANSGETARLSPGQSVQFPAPPPTVAKSTVNPVPTAAALPGPAYPQHAPLPHSTPQPAPPPSWEPSVQPQPQAWQSLPELEHRTPGGPPLRPWERANAERARRQQMPQRPGNRGPAPFPHPWPK